MARQMMILSGLRQLEMYSSDGRNFYGAVEITMKRKVRIYIAVISSILLYSCKVWPRRVEDIKKLFIFHYLYLKYFIDSPTGSHMVVSTFVQMPLILTVPS